jgi:hypothetical protein
VDETRTRGLRRDRPAEADLAPKSPWETQGVGGSHKAINQFLLRALSTPAEIMQ